MNHIHLRLIKRIVLGVVALATVYIIWLGIFVWCGIYLPAMIAVIASMFTGVLSCIAFGIYSMTYENMEYEERKKQKVLDAAVEEILRSKQ